MFAYFHTKNKTLTAKIDDLIKKTEEQDLIIQKHDHLLKILLKNKKSQPAVKSSVRPVVSKPLIKPIKEENEEDLGTSALLDMELESELAELDEVCEGNACMLITGSKTKIEELSENEQD